MEKISLRRISILIGLTILVTIGFQCYWTFENYKVLAQRIQNEIQGSLDNSVDDYYASLAKGNLKKHQIFQELDGDSIMFKSFLKIDTLSMDSSVNHISVERNFTSIRTSQTSREGEKHVINWNIDSSHRSHFKDSTLFKNLDDLTQMVIISLKEDELNLENLKELLDADLQQKAINIDYKLALNDTFQSGNILKCNSSYLSDDNILLMSFEGASDEILSRGIFGMLISLLVSLIIIFALLILYRQVKNQKELSEIKDDLISNMTHEFKTPIATVNAALEGIVDFNKNQDFEKTKRYVKMSQVEMKKLGALIDKFLDTASFDASELKIEKKASWLDDLIEKLVQPYLVLAKEKEVILDLNFEKSLNIDPFYFETAFTNILDNAVKYGGDNIKISSIENSNGTCEISISDNGGNIPTHLSSKVFDKFYRIPKGDLHDVKGHGIGLYSSKQIIEKHGGTLELNAGKTETTFIITLP